MASDDDRPSVGKRAAKAAGRYGALRLARAIPGVGWVVSAAMVGSNVRRKGWAPGLVDSALNVTPVVGRVKAASEFLFGEWIAEREDPDADPTPRG